MDSAESRATVLTASISPDANVDEHTGFKSLVRGSSTRLISSSGLGWAGVSLELHHVSPVDMGDSLSSQHIVALCVDHLSRGTTVIVCALDTAFVDRVRDNYRRL